MLSDVPAEFAVSGGVTISRDPGGTWSNGRFTAGTRATTAGVVATFQPLRGSEIEMLPEGDRDKRSGRVSSATEIKSADKGSQLMADQIVFDGDTWEVRSVSKHHFGGYWEAFVVRVGN